MSTQFGLYLSFFLNWLIWLALFPIAYFWLRRAWKIAVRRDFSEVALKKGEAAPQAQKWAPYELVLCLIGGVIVLVCIPAALLGVWSFDVWSAVAGSTIWSKLMLSFALGRHAHKAK